MEPQVIARHLIFAWLHREITELQQTDPSLHPFYATLIGGPILDVTGILHALLTGYSKFSYWCCEACSFCYLLRVGRYLLHILTFDGCDEIYKVGTFYVGDILFLIALLHAGRSERMGVLTSVLIMLYVMLMSAGLISYGEAICLHQYHSRTHADYCMMLAGGIVSL